MSAAIFLPSNHWLREFRHTRILTHRYTFAFALALALALALAQTASILTANDVSIIIVTLIGIALRIS